MDKHTRIKKYQEQYLAEYGFEAEMVRYRRKLLIERILAINPKVVVEVGCGCELLYEHYRQTERDVDRWVVVEPASKFYAIAAASGLPNFVAVQGFLEDSIEKLRTHLPAPADMVILSGVLSEVASPIKVLTAARSIMSTLGVVHVNVPNANSFHRLLGKSMGLIAKVDALSCRNIEMLQYRVYDLTSLRKDIEQSGLIPVSEGGYFIKPFTHVQMSSLSAELGRPVLDGLYHLGKEHPEIASEIYIEARNA